MTPTATAGVRPVREHCPVCAAESDEPFLTIARAPAHCNILWNSADAARRAPMGRIELTFCGCCGHVFNRGFDERLTTYGATYENSLHHSAAFESYADQLAEELVARHDLRDRDIIEIGAGQGDLLEKLCRTGGNRGTGFDPSYVGRASQDGPVRAVADFYDERYADHPADFIVCRHVLEHIDDASGFVAMVREAIGHRDVTTYFEVPDVTWTLCDGGIWDIIHEHCGYFSPASLATAFAVNGFSIERMETAFGGQFLTAEARPRDDAQTVVDDIELDALPTFVETFTARYRAAVDRWESWLAARRARGERGVIWGAGSKGVTLLNVLDASDVIDRAVDVNPRKHGTFVAGSGQPVVPPPTLVDAPPDFVVVTNPNYVAEIEAELKAVGVEREIVPVARDGSPNDPL